MRTAVGLPAIFLSQNGSIAATFSKVKLQGAGKFVRNHELFFAVKKQWIRAYSACWLGAGGALAHGYSLVDVGPSV